MGILDKFGNYPPEYNKAVHGPYYPFKYYGKKDTPLSEVKLSELVSWLSRRNKSPRAFVSAISRAYWRHSYTWLGPKKPGPAGIYQIMAFMSLFGFFINYPDAQNEIKYRYH